MATLPKGFTYSTPWQFKLEVGANLIIENAGYVGEVWPTKKFICSSKQPKRAKVLPCKKAKNHYLAFKVILFLNFL